MRLARQAGSSYATAGCCSCTGRSTTTGRCRRGSSTRARRGRRRRSARSRRRPACRAGSVMRSGAPITSTVAGGEGGALLPDDGDGEPSRGTRSTRCAGCRSPRRRRCSPTSATPSSEPVSRQGRLAAWRSAACWSSAPGQMGGGIAQVVAASGREVSLLDAQPGATDRALETMRAEPRQARREGRAVRPTTSFARVQRRRASSVEADLLIEAVVEDAAVKEEVFRARRPDAARRTRSSPRTRARSRSARSPQSPRARARDRDALLQSRCRC